MSGSGRKDQDTVTMATVRGNALFEQAVAALALDDKTTRWLLVSVMATLGCSSDGLTPDDLGHLLPEVDRRLRLLVDGAQADAAIKRLYRVLFDQAGPA